MKKIKYLVSENEYIALIPEGSIIRAFLLFEEDYEGLLYIPKNVKYIDVDQKEHIDKGECASLSFAKYDFDKKVWIRSGNDYLNLSQNKISKVFGK